MDKDLLLWLYEQKDEIDAHLSGAGKYDRAEGNSRLEYYAQLNLLDRIIRYIKQGKNRFKKLIQWLFKKRWNGV